MAIGKRGGTLRGANATGYLITLPESKPFVQVASKGGTFWVQFLSVGDVAAAGTAAAIPGAGAQTAFSEVPDGWTASSGVAPETAVRSLTPSIAAISVYCEVAGDLIVVS
jgi:hypothetical protein